METLELRPEAVNEGTPAPTTQGAAMVYDAIRGVSLELSHEGISKERSNQLQGYKFRGIDDCLNALSGLLPKYGLIIVPTVEAREQVERQTQKGGTLFYVTVRVRFSFISTLDGSRQDAVIYGEAMDSSDKATNKAMSAAYKYCVLLTFCIPTEAEDADSVTHDVAPQPSTKDFASKFPAQAKAIQAKLATAPYAEKVAALTSVVPADPAPMRPGIVTSISRPLLPAGGWKVPVGPNAGRLLSDLTDEDVDYQLRKYLSKLSDPANAKSRFRDEWEQAVLEIRAELLARYPEAEGQP